MYLFEKIFEYECNRPINGNWIENIFIFTNKFKPGLCKKKKQYTWKKYTKYKYFILKNFLCANNFDTTKKEHLLDIFSTTQNKLLALYKFKNICLFKTKKLLDDQMDLNFNPLSEMSSRYKIDIIQDNIRQQFSIFDLTRIINTSLSYEYNFFPDPTKIKNPWNNKPFSIANLYNIYFFIKNNSNINMSILFSRFYQSNFCLNHFELYNQFIIKNYIIENCHLFDESKKVIYIHVMLDYYNSKYKSFAINIDLRFPVKRLIDVMDKYIKLYLLAIYSYEDDLRIKYKSILMRRLRTFNKENPFFGRRIVSLSVKKLYYMSRLYYEEKHIIFLPDNVYFPKPDMILLDQQCYLVDYIENNNYSIFPIFDSTSQYDNREQKIIELLSPIIKKYTFNETQLDIIKNKYYSIVCEKIQAGNNTSDRLNDDEDQYQDQDQDNDTDTYTDDLDDNEITNNEITNNVMSNNDQILDQSFDTADTYDSDEIDETIIHPIIDQADISIDSDNDIMDDNISINSFEHNTADLHINDSNHNQIENQSENINTTDVNLTQQARHTLILRLDYFQRNDLMNEEDYQHIIRSILQLVDDDML
jgi:hypothetical protein